METPHTLHLTNVNVKTEIKSRKNFKKYTYNEFKIVNLTKIKKNNIKGVMK
jgi:hypothetical protein